MGQEVLYCTHCQVRLTTADFEKGIAVRLSGNPWCSKCARGKTPDPDKGTSSQRLRVVTNPDPVTPRHGTGYRLKPITTRRAVVKSPAKIGGTLALLGGAAIVTFLLLSLLTHPAPKDTAAVAPPLPAAPPSEPPPVVTPPPPAAPGKIKAEILLKNARTYRNEHPADLNGQIERFQQARWESEGTAFLQEARREYEELLNRRKESFAAALAPLDDEIGRMTSDEEYGTALKRLAKERSRDASVDWTLLIDKRLRDVQEVAFGRFSNIKNRAADARKREAWNEALQLRERVTKWGLSEYLTELDRILGAIPPRTP